MKNRAQFISFIETVKPKYKNDRKRITEYCLQHEIRVSFPEDKGNLTQITYNDFVAWAESDTPGIGSVITYETSYSITIGIISAASPAEITLGVALIGEDGLITDVLTRPNSDYRDATEEEILKVHRALARKGYSWNLWHNKIVKCHYVPRKNLFVRFRSYTRNHYGVGVFKEINDANDIVMYCFKSGEEPVRYSLNEIIGEKGHYQIAPANKGDIQLLKEELYKVGKMWNGYQARIQPTSFFVDEGQEYCYINDRGKIMWDHNNGSQAHQERLAVGNIFITSKQAEDFLAKILELRKLDLCRPT